MFFIRMLFAKVCHPNLESFVWGRHVCVLLRDTNMAAVGRRKVTETSQALSHDTIHVRRYSIQILALEGIRIIPPSPSTGNNGKLNFV